MPDEAVSRNVSRLRPQSSHKSCSLCRYAKIKCSGDRPSCHRCSVAGSTCEYALRAARTVRPRKDRPASEAAERLRPSKSAIDDESMTGRTSCSATGHAGHGKKAIGNSDGPRHIGPSDTRMDSITADKELSLGNPTSSEARIAVHESASPPHNNDMMLMDPPDDHGTDNYLSIGHPNSHEYLNPSPTFSHPQSELRDQPFPPAFANFLPFQHTQTGSSTGPGTRGYQDVSLAMGMPDMQSGDSALIPSYADFLRSGPEFQRIVVSTLAASAKRTAKRNALEMDSSDVHGERHSKRTRLLPLEDVPPRMGEPTASSSWKVTDVSSDSVSKVERSKCQTNRSGCYPGLSVSLDDCIRIIRSTGLLDDIPFESLLSAMDGPSGPDTAGSYTVDENTVPVDMPGSMLTSLPSRSAAGRVNADRLGVDDEGDTAYEVELHDPVMMEISGPISGCTVATARSNFSSTSLTVEQQVRRAEDVAMQVVREALRQSAEDKQVAAQQAGATISLSTDSGRPRAIKTTDLAGALAMLGEAASKQTYAQAEAEQEILLHNLGLEHSALRAAPAVINAVSVLQKAILSAFTTAAAEEEDKLRAFSAAFTNGEGLAGRGVGVGEEEEQEDHASEPLSPEVAVPRQESEVEDGPIACKHLDSLSDILVQLPPMINKDEPTLLDILRPLQIGIKWLRHLPTCRLCAKNPDLAIPYLTAVTLICKILLSPHPTAPTPLPINIAGVELAGSELSIEVQEHIISAIWADWRGESVPKVLKALRDGDSYRPGLEAMDFIRRTDIEVGLSSMMRDGIGRLIALIDNGHGH